MKIKIPKEVSPAKQYGGLDINELTEKIVACVKKHNGMVRFSVWNRSAVYSYQKLTWDDLVMSLSEFECIFSTYTVRATHTIQSHTNDTHGFRFDVSISTPGPASHSK